MYLYNVTINIEEEILDRWLEWMKTEHIPEMLDTGKFSKAMMGRVMVDEPMGGITYSVQYTTDSKETLEKYYEEDAERLRAQSNPFKEKFVAFRSEMDVMAYIEK